MRCMEYEVLDRKMGNANKIYTGKLQWKESASSSSAGPRAYAPDALQPVGLLYYACAILLF
jgi:hypothetical protein